MKLLRQESGKTLSTLEYYWRPPLIGDPLSLETPSHQRPPLIREPLSSETTARTCSFTEKIIAIMNSEVVSFKESKIQVQDTHFS